MSYKPKGKITTKDRDYIVMTVKKKLYPMWTALFITAVKDTMGVSNEDVAKILKTANQYAGHYMNGLVNINDFKKTIEKDLGVKLEEFLKI